MSVLAALLLACAASSPAPPARLDTERHLEREVPAASGRVAIFHGFGECNVFVVPAKERPRARLDLVASGAGAAAEKSYLERVDLSVADEPSPGDPDARVLTIRSRFPLDQQKPESLSFAANLTVWLPEGAAVAIDNGYGKVLVDGRKGDVKVVNKLGVVEVRNVRGKVDVDDQTGEVVLADVNGDAIVHGKTMPVTAERVSGRVEVRTNGGLVRIDGAGSVHVQNLLRPVDVRNVAGDATIVAPFCAVTAKEVGGTLSIDSGNAAIVVDGVGKDLSIQHKTGKIEARRIRGNAVVMGNLSDVTLADVGGTAEVRSPSAPVKVSNVAGKLVAENSARTLELVNARGDVEASARGGLLKARWTKLPADGAPHVVTLEGETAGIELEIPDGAALALDVTSTIGQIDCAIPGMHFAINGATRTGTLELGGVPDPQSTPKRVELHATCVGGAIRVRRASAQ